MARFIIGSDDLYHCALEAVDHLKKKGHEVVVVGALRSMKPEPWPDVAREVAERVANREFDYGIVVCYTGTGVSIVANKVPGVRAALCNDPLTARGARLWNDANVLAMSGRLVTNILVREIIDEWLSVDQPDPSEVTNINKINDIEREYCKCNKHHHG